MALENTDKAIGEMLDKVQTLVSQHGEQAVALAGKVYQADAISNLIGGGILLAVSSACAYACYRIVKSLRNEGFWAFDEGEVLGTVASVLSGLAAVVLFGISVGLLADIATWWAAGNPTIALAVHLLHHTVAK